MQCEKSSDLTTLKIVQSERAITLQFYRNAKSGQFLPFQSFFIDA